MGSLGGIVRVANPASAEAITPSLSDLKEKDLPGAWQLMEELAQLSEKGFLPDDTLLSKIALIGSLKQK